MAGMFTRIEDCANRALITPVAANELILESKLAPKKSGAGLAGHDSGRNARAFRRRE